MRKIHFAIVVDIWVGFQFLKICPRVHIPKFDFFLIFIFRPKSGVELEGVRYTRRENGPPKKQWKNEFAILSFDKNTKIQKVKDREQCVTQSPVRNRVPTRLGKGYGR